MFVPHSPAVDPGPLPSVDEIVAPGPIQGEKQGKGGSRREEHTGLES